MAVDTSSDDGQAIRKLVPIANLATSHFESLCAQITIQDATRNDILFKRGDVDPHLYYLLHGEVSFQAAGLSFEVVKSETESAKFALAHQVPRKIDAVARSSIRYIKLPANLLDCPLTQTYEEEISSMVIIEPEENSDDWMTTLLRSPIFQRLPPANLQKILMSLEEVIFEKGEMVLRQGDPGDYYYLIKSGQCLLTRKPSEHAKEIKLALLRDSDTFGEDSILSEKPRNVTVTALTKLSLLRLSKDNFINLIKKPSLRYVDYEQMCREVKQGALLLDVRSTEAFNSHHLEDSLSAPFFTLRMQVKTLNRNRPVIVVCNNGKTSEAAAFLLLKNKIKASILDGGIENVAPALVKSAASFAIDDGVETTFVVPQKLVEVDEPEKVSITENNTDSMLERLQMENSALHDANDRLKAMYEQLKLEKEEADREFRMLYRQTEKLKSILGAMKKNPE
jgi:CRP-like cAMP-binding protein